MLALGSADEAVNVTVSPLFILVVLALLLLPAYIQYVPIGTLLKVVTPFAPLVAVYDALDAHVLFVYACNATEYPVVLALDPFSLTFTVTEVGLNTAVSMLFVVVFLT